MFEKLKDFLDVFREGKSVVNAIKLKNQQLIGNAITVLLGGLVVIGRLYGVDFHLSDADLLHLGYGIAVVLGMFNVGATAASTDKIGLPGLAPAGPMLPPITSEHVDAVLADRATRLPPVDPPAQPANAPTDADYSGGN